ncbi:uncharacterized protein PADG_12348 [Paracoccidioides brasiliensis Pb18]|uniref:Uncharacterized protein n=1 Tax=Paracoccidioides brasiliensis (strain Pb18) TaxID=502780 RepID=A0A0A0HTD4_PARBD|nr:uncharacterized protein PADG_12348 [Paracoccidioides brasiliensis Pb18]KGM91573.1 hypothetical protein PADG_12348 [Paracoccidioides brasiliensis Pb18]
MESDLGFRFEVVLGKVGVGIILTALVAVFRTPHDIPHSQKMNECILKSSVHAITMVAFTRAVSSDDTFFPTLALFNELPGGGGRHVPIFDQYRHNLIATVFTATSNPNDPGGGALHQPAIGEEALRLSSLTKLWCIPDE